MRAMNLMKVFLTVVTVVQCIGCAAQRSAGAAPADNAKLAAVRRSIQVEDPNAVVGLVIEVLPDRPFAAVAELPLDQLHFGDAMTFIDSNQHILTHGIVRRITSRAVHVEFVRPLGRGRAPRPGDLAVRFTR